LNLVDHTKNTRDDLRAYITLYARKKIQMCKCNEYQAYLFIFLDDAASSELISKNNAPFIQLLKICRHMHTSCAICVQTVRDCIKELKRLIDDVYLYLYLTYNEWEQTVNTVPT
jgi:hypothetical protein